MSYTDRYLQRQERRKVQFRAATVIRDRYPDLGARVKSESRNIYVYFDSLDKVRYRVGPINTWKEVNAADPGQPAHWCVTKTYSTTKIALATRSQS